MARTADMFVHVLLFECPKSGDPIPAHLVVRDSNMESVDGSHFDLKCPCDWTGQQLGIRARRHWVEPWSDGHAAD
jgi:hypothetical protein